MSRKTDLMKAIAESEKEIELLEKKRTRSQSALLEAYVDELTPSSADVEYFRVYTKLIKLERENLHQLQKELEKYQ